MLPLQASRQLKQKPLKLSSKQKSLLKKPLKKLKPLPKWPKKLLKLLKKQLKKPPMRLLNKQAEMLNIAPSQSGRGLFCKEPAKGFPYLKNELSVTEQRC